MNVGLRIFMSALQGRANPSGHPPAFIILAPGRKAGAFPFETLSNAIRSTARETLQSAASFVKARPVTIRLICDFSHF